VYNCYKEIVKMNWQLVKIEDVFDVARGGSPRPISEYLTEDEEGINWIMIGDTKGEGKYIYSTAKRIKPEGVKNSRMVKEGDFLLTNSMSFGRPYILKTSGCIHDGWLVLSPKNENIHTDYFYYYLGSQQIKDKLSSKAAGAVVKNLNKDIVKGLKISLPPLATQKKIAAILDAADDLRQKTQQIISEYDQLAQSIFLEMFGDPVINPKGWEKKKLGEVCSKITDGTHHSPKPQSEGYPYVTAKHVKESGLNFLSKPSFVSEEAHNEIYKRCTPEYGDVLYIKDGATTGIACINTFKEPISLLSSLALLKLNNKIINNYFLCFWLNNKGIKERLISEFMSGAAIKRYTLKKINLFIINIPPIALQTQFAEKIALIEQQKELAKQSLAESADLFNALLQKAFKGELVN